MMPTSKIEKFYLIDDSALSHKNLPYLTLGKGSQQVGQNKAVVLSEMLNDIKGEELCIPICNSFPLTDMNHDIYSGMIIDCRDSSDTHPACNLKVNADGGFGLISFPPFALKQEEKRSRYQIYNSRYIISNFAMFVCKLLFGNDVNLERFSGNRYIIKPELLDNEMYPVPDEYIAYHADET